MTNTDELIEKVARALAKLDDQGAPIAAYRAEAISALNALGLLDGTNMLIPNWRDSSEAEPDKPFLGLLSNGERAVLCEPPKCSRYDYYETPTPSRAIPIEVTHPADWIEAYREGGGPTVDYFIPLSSIPTPEKADGTP